MHAQLFEQHRVPNVVTVPAPRPVGLWSRWLLANVVGEIVGFGLAAVAGARSWSDCARRRRVAVDDAVVGEGGSHATA